MGEEWAGLFFPQGKNGPAHSFPGEKTDWGEIPACYTGYRHLILVRRVDCNANLLVKTESIQQSDLIKTHFKRTGKSLCSLLPYFKPV